MIAARGSGGTAPGSSTRRRAPSGADLLVVGEEQDELVAEPADVGGGEAG